LGDVTQRPGWVSQGTEQGNNLVDQNSGGSPEPHGNSMRVWSAARRGQQSCFWSHL